ncbi:MAG: DUF4037 domain-containing protein [Ardenticatenaceae bacterium]
MIPPPLADAPLDLREAIDKLIAEPHVQGLVLVGSRSRGYNDGKSDFDLEAIVDDHFYEQLAPLNRLALVWDGKPFESRLIGDIYTESRSHMEAKRHSLLDVDHWPYEVCSIWYDKNGDMVPLISGLGHFPEEIWETRLNVHHVDFWYHVSRARKIAERDSKLNYALVLTRAIHAYIKCIFVLNRRWPPLVHWGQHALERSNLPLRPANDVALLTQALTTLDIAPLQQLVEALPPLLDKVGQTLHQKRLDQFVTVLGPTYTQARQQWSRY